MFFNVHYKWCLTQLPHMRSRPHSSSYSSAQLLPLHISNTSLLLPKNLCKTHFLSWDIFSGMSNAVAAALSCFPAEKAIEESGIWQHLFLSRCDQLGDLLLCFNSEVKGAFGMRLRIRYMCVCVCERECVLRDWGDLCPVVGPNGPCLTFFPPVFGCGCWPRVTGVASTG